MQVGLSILERIKVGFDTPLRCLRSISTCSVIPRSILFYKGEIGQTIENVLEIKRALGSSFSFSGCNPYRYSETGAICAFDRHKDS